MYDPARDIFTSSDDPPPDAPAPADGSNGPPHPQPDAVRGSEKDEENVTQAKPKATPLTETASLEPDCIAHGPGPAKVPAQASSDQPATRHNGAASSGHSTPVAPVAHPADAIKVKRPHDIENPRAKRRRSMSPADTTYKSPVPMTADNLPRFTKKKAPTTPADRRQRTPPDRRSSGGRSRSPERHLDRKRRASRSPERHLDRRRWDRRSPIPPRSPSPLRRSPTPPPRSPPRKLKRPGGASRISVAEREAFRQRQLEREQEQKRSVLVEVAKRGVQDVVKQHYNAVPERGREWRKTDSRIRGLRSFNNWVKSTIIQKFSPNEDYKPDEATYGGDDGARKGLTILDIGCGKGGDLGKWQQAPQPVELYVGLDPADVSIDQARERYRQMRSGGGRGPRGAHGRPSKTFQAEFFVQDAFGEYLGTLPLIRDVGIDAGVGPGGATSSRWGGGGFDVVSMMFCMHYAFESEAKARGMLRNVAGCLKKGGRLLGVIPNSDMLTDKVVEFHERTQKEKEKEKEKETEQAGDSTHTNGTGAIDSAEKEEGEVEETLEWGNGIYRVRFPGNTPTDGIFRPPFGWKYSYFLEEAIEEIPEYVVPWEAFRALAEDYNLELQYRKPFMDVWREENDDPILGPLSERMNVRGRGKGPLMVSDEELEAASFYLAFCFYKV
ncbi:MAG: mRNA cap guanine-N7 methyltransferase [Thelocarpon superellum]|nr:MAG: mRNA cap guanine-N7 methyltransferase [Thelocarpon superellum]